MAEIDQQAASQANGSPPTEVTVRLAPEDIAALATAIAEAKVRMAREDIAALAAAITKGLHEKFRSPNFQFDVLHRLPYSQDSADYVSANMPLAMKVPGKENHLKFALARIGEGMILEFGVFKGASINQIATAVPDRQIHGFDSFEGLPEDWTGYNVTTEAFDQQGKMPNVKENVSLSQGLVRREPAAVPGGRTRSRRVRPRRLRPLLVDQDGARPLGPRIQPGTVLVVRRVPQLPVLARARAQGVDGVLRRSLGRVRLHLLQQPASRRSRSSRLEVPVA